MDNKIYDIETVDFLLTLSEDELREKISEFSIAKTPLITSDCVHFGVQSIGFVNGLGLYLYAQYLNLQNFLSPQKKIIMDMVDKRIKDLRHCICGSDVLKNFM